MKAAPLVLLAALALGCASGGGKPENAIGPGDLSKLTPQEQIDKVQADPNMPPEAKQTAITSIKAKNGMP